MVQWVEDLVLSLHWLRSILWHGFDPWPGNFHMPWVQPPKKTNKNLKKSCYMNLLFFPVLFFILFSKFLLLFRATPVAYGSSQARGRIGTALTFHWQQSHYLLFERKEWVLLSPTNLLSARQHTDHCVLSIKQPMGFLPLNQMPIGQSNSFWKLGYPWFYSCYKDMDRQEMINKGSLVCR